MDTLAVLGAGGYTGRLVVAACRAHGHHPVLIGRDPERIRDRLAADGITVEDLEVRRADVTDPASLRTALDGVDVLLTTVGPFDQLGRDVLDAAIDTGVHYVDSTGEQPFLRWAFGERHTAARDAGIVAVPAAAFEFVPGDLLADLAAAAVTWPREIHVAYTVPSSGLLGFASAGTRRTVASLLGRDGLALVRGELLEELPAESRRLAWFPRPVGPRHAAGIPGGEPLMVPRHVEGVETVRTYLAMPAWKAELGQLGANLARWDPMRRGLRAVLEGSGRDPSPQRRATTRWGCVAEAEGTDGVARAWAYGHDIYGLTALTMLTVAEAIIQRAPAAGVLPPASVAPADELLDILADRCDLRWSIARPTSDAGADAGPSDAGPGRRDVDGADRSGEDGPAAG